MEEIMLSDLSLLKKSFLLKSGRWVWLETAMPPVFGKEEQKQFYETLTLL
jgi:hypothetical protein